MDWSDLMITKVTEVAVRKHNYWRPKDLQISKKSSYEDEVWNFDGSTVSLAGNKRRVDWRAFKSGHVSLIDSSFQRLLEELKCLTWTLIFDRTEGDMIKEGTIGKLGVGLKELVSWMIERGHTSLSMITNQESWNYLNWFRENHAREKMRNQPRRDTTFSTAWQALHTLTYVFEQGSALQDRGFKAIPSAPYDGRNAHDLTVRELGLKRGDKMDAIPDEIALPVLREAARWVEERSDDIARLHREWLAHVETKDSGAARGQAIDSLLNGFRFSIDPATGKPWTSMGDHQSRVSSYASSDTSPPGMAPRRLVCDFIGACLIVIQGMTGMRPGDLASVQTTTTHEGTRLPSCIEKKVSPDGLTEMFLLKGVEQKASHTAHSWVLGGRLSGTDDLPLPLKATMLLDDLLAPYRDAANVSSLIVTFCHPRSMAAKPGFVGSFNTTWFNNVQRDFIVNQVGIPMTPHKRGIQKTGFEFRTAQWRTTFAMFVIRTNKRALGPLAKHFHHVDTLMTEHGYIGNDPELLQLVDDARVTVATNTLYSILSDAEPFAGGLQAHLHAACGELRSELRGASPDDGFEKIRGMVIEHDLRLHFTDYGACGIALTPSVARCHELAGRPSTDQVRPDFGTRRPGVCAGCRNFLVSTENLGYWRLREKQLAIVKSGQKESAEWRLGRELALARQFVKTLEEGVSKHVNVEEAVEG
jgi:hypothetical protein